MSGARPAKRRRASVAAQHEASDSGQIGGSGNSDKHGMAVETSEMQHQMARKLVRHALAMEFRREPLRWKQLTNKLALRSKQLQPVFALAQEYLVDVFGLELRELPLRKNGRMTESNESSAKAYYLINKLPERMLEQQISLTQVLQIHRDKLVHLGLAAFVIALISISGESLPSKELQAMCRRVGISESKPLGGFDQLMVVLTRLQYIENVKSSILEADGSFQSEYCVGPRGKIQVFDKAIFAMIRKVYGESMTPQIESKMQRIARAEKADSSAKAAERDLSHQNQRKRTGTSVSSDSSGTAP